MSESRGRSLTRTVTLGKRGRSVSASTRMVRTRVPRLLGLKAEKLYRFVRKTGVTYALNPSTGMGVGGTFSYGSGHTYKLSEVSIAGQNATATLPNAAAEFQALFEFWRIDQIRVRMFYSHSPSGAQTAPSNATGYPMLYICPDFTDGAAPTSAAQIQQKSDCRIVQLGNARPTSITFRPKPAQAVFQFGTFSGYAANQSQDVWLSTSYPLSENYGLKIWYQPLDTTNALNGQIFMDIEYHLSFKGVN